ncbi:hypothetical protein BDV28DRAFT_31128 [Aspergillus coremiiformis]|uniref:NmrA-like domain-containing protein n=1 Tax=Aspergillus coremiiformis TaxID=138285 RepID=A0A5N6ZEQ4_9EURO|nr:hypothetical protein BDV28DRAFT_31128 [Aspergillus coremiiformis]
MKGHSAGCFGEVLIPLQRHKAHRSVNETPCVAVDYDDLSGTATSLEAANVDTVICAFGMESDAVSEAQVNLIHAADMSKSTRRFVVSGYDMLFQEAHIPIVPIAKWTLAAIHAVEKTKLEYTRVVNGLFLDYYGLPHWSSHLKPWVNAVNPAGKWAVLPGDGSAPVNFITSQDMARFVVRLMDLPEWSPVSYIAGQTTTFQKILQLAEDARGERFSVKYERLEDLRKGRISFPEFYKTGLESTGQSSESIFALFHYLSSTGGYTIVSDDTLDARFPDVKITTAAEVIQSSWRGR